MIPILLVIFGIYGLARRRIKISAKRELTGAPVIFLSTFYLIMAALFFLGVNIQYDMIPWAIVIVVTLLVVIFAKGNPPNRLNS